jgi:hypothetical protein
MRRLMLLSAALALLSLSAVTASATPMDRSGVGVRAPAITLIQGWWEQENRSDAPDRYWRLKRSEYNRYNGAQARIEQRHKKYNLDQYDRRDKQDLEEQHRILRFQRQQ